MSSFDGMSIDEIVKYAKKEDIAKAIQRKTPFRTYLDILTIMREHNHIIVEFKYEVNKDSLYIKLHKEDFYGFHHKHNYIFYDFSKNKGEWIAYKREGFPYVMHGKVIENTKVGLKIRNKKGDIRYCKFNEILGFTSKPTKTNPKPAICDFYGHDVPYLENLI